MVPQPYRPTLQHDCYCASLREKPPASVTNAEWSKAFNTANCDIYDHTAQEITTATCKASRENGRVTDDSIEKLIRTGVLPPNFVDCNPRGRSMALTQKQDTFCFGSCEISITCFALDNDISSSWLCLLRNLKRVQQQGRTKIAVNRILVS